MTGNKHINKVRTIWGLIKDAISGKDYDFTQGSLRKAIFLLSVPMVLEMVMESVFAVVDIFYVSRLGADAVAAVGITESLLTIVYALAMGLAVATTAVISRRIGEKKPKEASNAAWQAIITGFAVSLVIAMVGVFYAKELLQLMGASDELVEIGWKYPAILIGGNSIIMMLFIINAIFRGAGDAAVTMRVLFVANGLNLILDPIFIFGWGPIPEMGVTGAAIATSIGRGTAVLYQFYILLGAKKRIRLIWSAMRIDLPLIKRIVKLSGGTVGQSLISHSSWIALVRIISEFGSEAVAGYTIAIRIVIFSLLPSWGISNAAATLVGQNLGADKPLRAEQSAWMASKFNLALMGLFAVFFITMPEFFIRLFIDEPLVVRTGVMALRIISYGFLFYAVAMVMVASLNGAGDTTTPLRINIISFWIVEIPLAYAFALYLGYGEQGVYYSIVLAEGIMTAISIYVFRKGKWKTKAV